MGKYDNYNNERRIKVAKKEYEKLASKKKPDMYKIDLAKKRLEEELLFSSCQIFGRMGFLASGWNPQDTIMFNDDNRMVMFVDRIIHYDDIASYSIVENTFQKADTSTKTTGAVTRAIVGGAIAGGIGAVVGAASAGSKSKTTYYNVRNGYYIQIFLKDGKGWQYFIDTGRESLARKWYELGGKIQSIIDENGCKTE